MPGRLRPYSAQMAFAGIAIVLAMSSALLLAIATWACREFANQWVQYATYRDLQMNAARADSLTSAYSELGRELKSLRQALPSMNQSSHVVNMVVEEARKRDLGISGINAMDEIPFPGYVELPFEVGLSGTFPNLIRYFHSLETSGLAIQMRRVEIQNELLNGSKIKVRAELSVLSPTEPSSAVRNVTP